LDCTPKEEEEEEEKKEKKRKKILIMIVGARKNAKKTYIKSTHVYIGTHTRTATCYKTDPSSCQ
jgi:hypothetical protein